jgi:hypothetical protein
LYIFFFNYNYILFIQFYIFYLTILYIFFSLVSSILLVFNFRIYRKDIGNIEKNNCKKQLGQYLKTVLSRKATFLKKLLFLSRKATFLGKLLF